MKPARFPQLICLIPLLLILVQLGFALHCHGVGTYQDEQDCFHATSSIQCSLDDHTPQQNWLPAPATPLPRPVVTLVHLAAPRSPALPHTPPTVSLLPSRASPA